MRRIYPYFTLLLVIFLSTLLVWTPFMTKSSNWMGLKIENSSFDYIYRHYDGPLYIIPAKTFYEPAKLLTKEGANIIGITPSYFAAHLPFYPLLIKSLSGMFGYLKSMVLVNLISTVLLSWFFYFILKKFKLTTKPLLLTTVFLFLPRFLVIRSVGAPESLFILLILGSLYYFEKEKYWLAGLLGGLSVATKTPGILLFGAYCLTLCERLIKTKRINWNWVGIILIPLGLLAVFVIYWFKMGDFFAYFNSGDNIHLIFPFSVFNFQKSWIGTAWLEDVIFYFFLYGLTVVSLKDFKYRSFFYFSLIFYVAALFVQHRDIARYTLVLWPMALISFQHFFTSKKTMIMYIIIFSAVYLYAWNFLSYNVMPIADWAPYL